jgi:hypothetical protein
MGILNLLTNPPPNFKFYSDKGYVGNGETSGMKSYRFGQDRPGGGSSNQPYVQNPIQIDIKNPSFYNDFILRGGILAPISAANDVVRLSKYFIDLQNPNGILFTAKQNLLSRIGTKTEASKGLGYAGGALNEGIYTPLSTLAEAGIVWAGGHVNKQGLDPTGLFPGASINKYQDIISQNQLIGSYDVTFSDDGTLPDPKYVENNRLTKLTTIIPPNIGVNNFTFVSGYSLNPSLENDVLISYGGGPNSVLGIGKTKIKFATDNTGVPIKTLKPSFNPKTYLVGKPFSYIEQDKFQIPIGLTTSYEKSFNLLSPIVPNDLVKENLPYYQESVQTNVYESGLLENTDIIGKGSWTQKDFVNQPPNTNNEITEDFRKILNPSKSPQNTFLSVSPSYVDNNIETKLGLQNPGTKGNRSSYTIGKRNITDGALLGPIDKINASSIYKTNTKDGSKYGKEGGEDLADIVPFFIAILNNDSQVGGTYKKYMHFRAFIDSFSDSYTSEWNPIEYMGRAEKFYKYGGFERKISMAFTIVAQSREEITIMYDKLNFLASSLAPEYLDSYTSGYMAGNIAYITLGGYLDDQPGVITSLTFDVPEESPWEIGIDDSGKRLPIEDIRQLPHMIRVTGINFIPIHKFRPEKQSFRNDKLGTDSTRLLNTGKQRYIDQLRPESTNYDKESQEKYTTELKTEQNAQDFKNAQAILLQSNENLNILTNQPTPTNVNTGLGNQQSLFTPSTSLIN